MAAHTTPAPELAGKFYWPSPEYSTPANNLCWHTPPAPNRDFRCIRALGHPGKCLHEWSPTVRDYSHRAHAEGAGPLPNQIPNIQEN